MDKKSNRLRSLRSRASANRRWALASAPERRESTVKAQEAFWLKLDAQVDPNSELEPGERRVRAVQLWKAKMYEAKADRLSRSRGGAA